MLLRIHPDHVALGYLGVILLADDRHQAQVADGFLRQLGVLILEIRQLDLLPAVADRDLYGGVDLDAAALARILLINEVLGVLLGIIALGHDDLQAGVLLLGFFDRHADQLGHVIVLHHLKKGC